MCVGSMPAIIATQAEGKAEKEDSPNLCWLADLVPPSSGVSK